MLTSYRGVSPARCCFAVALSEVEGINSMGKSVLVLFRVVVARARGWRRQSGVGAYWANVSDIGGLVTHIFTGLGEPRAAILRWHKGVTFFLPKVCYAQRFYAVGLFWLRRCKGFKGIRLRKP